MKKLYVLHVIVPSPLENGKRKSHKLAAFMKVCVGGRLQ